MKIFLDSGALAAIQSCPRRAYFQLVRRKVPATESPALSFGKAIHEALAYRYRIRSFSRPASLEVASRIVRHYLDRQDNWRNPDTAERLLRYYWRVAETSDFGNPIRIHGSLAVEIPFAVETGWSYRDMEVVYIGRIDLITEERDGIHVVDHKTASVPCYDPDVEWGLSNQLIGYAWAASHIHPVEKVTVNHLLVRPNIASAEWQDDAGFWVGAKGGEVCSINRYTFRVWPEMIHEWEEAARSCCLRFLQTVVTSPIPPAGYFSNCRGVYGPCPYASVCSAVVEARDGILCSEAYKDATWTPLART